MAVISPEAIRHKDREALRKENPTALAEIEEGGQTGLRADEQTGLEQTAGANLRAERAERGGVVRLRTPDGEKFHE